MKKLSDYIHNQYVSLKDIDESIAKRLENLNGYEINECDCCGCCDPCCEPCGCEMDVPCDNTALAGTPVPAPVATPINYNAFGRFNSINDITRELDTHPTVTTLNDLHAQFGAWCFDANRDGYHTEPLYFGYKTVVGGAVDTVNRENGDMPASEADGKPAPVYNEVQTRNNKTIYKAVKDICSAHTFQSPVVETKINGEVQVYVVKNTGTNGKEGSIKSSLEQVVKILDKLDAREDVKWSQVLDVSIDNLDDLYYFVITFVFDADKVRETYEVK